ncbi:LysR family transcriptional regulator [Nioella sp.]|uniref:LysR family transcriptional regulator n=1 Tax=Nioella sp. TaxID=1912091 RepID=UPI003A8A1AA2
MARPINLRQIEIFKAVIEHGTVSRAAEIMAISQPAASKLLVHLEADTELNLFDRQKGRLIPTPVALQLYQEIDRIFASVKEVEIAVQLIKQDFLGRLSVGIIPALADKYVQSVTTAFMQSNPRVHCSIQPLASQWVAESLRIRQIDLGIMMTKLSDPGIEAEVLSEDNLVCIMPKGHDLSCKRQIEPQDLNGHAFISFKADSLIGQKVETVLDRYAIRVDKIVTAHSSTTLRQFVVAGQGIALVHPFFVADIADQLVIRPFEPELTVQLFMYHATGARNIDLIQSYMSFCRTEAMRAADLVRAGR